MAWHPPSINENQEDKDNEYGDDNRQFKKNNIIDDYRRLYTDPSH